jgi:hypothetical protein
VSSVLRKKLLVLAKLSADVHVILLLEELLRLAEDVLQLRQLQEVLLQRLGVLVDL